MPKQKTFKELWSFKNSIFKDWRRDDEVKYTFFFTNNTKKELLGRCFEEDWKNTRIPRIVKKEDDLANTKEVLRNVYK